MAKYTITMSCGHAQKFDILGPEKDRARKIKWIEENGICTDCKNRANQGRYDEKTVLYRDYKTNEEYAACKTKPGSYDPKKKTLVLLIERDDAIGYIEPDNA